MAIEVTEVCAVAYPDDIHAVLVKVKTILTDYKDYEVGKSTTLSDFFLRPVAANPYVTAWPQLKIKS